MQAVEEFLAAVEAHVPERSSGSVGTQPQTP